MQDFGWLQPTRNSAPLPANSVVAQREAGNVARAPKSSEDSQNVRNFVSQAAFSNGQQQAGSSQQGRRLAEVRTDGLHMHHATPSGRCSPLPTIAK